MSRNPSWLVVTVNLKKEKSLKKGVRAIYTQWLRATHDLSVEEQETGSNVRKVTPQSNLENTEHAS